MSLRSSRPCLLMLEDGTVFHGKSCGAEGEAFGEVVFNTSMCGYFEILTDPSYNGQIICMTYPQIGNYGVALEDAQSGKVFAGGLVVRDMCDRPSNFRSCMSLPDFLKENGVVAIEGIDTRKLVKHVRENGAMKAVITTSEDPEGKIAKRLASAPRLSELDLVGEVSSKEKREASAAPDPRRHKVVAIDCGIKQGILDGLTSHGCDVEVLPYHTSFEVIEEIDPDGVFLSNGPGDPESVPQVHALVGKLIGRYPVFGICLGHQMLSIAAGARIEKLKYGHHGGNQPVMNLLTHAVETTSQNHGFGQVFESMGPLVAEMSGGVSEHPENLLFWVEKGIAPVVTTEEHGRVQLTHVNLNDGTPEGMRFLDHPVFSVQYHPESCPGPHDSSYLFEAFSRLMDGDEDYLDIEVRQARGAKIGKERA